MKIANFNTVCRLLPSFLCLGVALTPWALTREGPPVDLSSVQVSASLPESSQRVGITGRLQISLQEAITHVLAANHDIEDARIEQELSRFDLAAAKGVYDPRFSAETRWQRAVTPSSSVIGGAAEGKLTQTEISGSPRLSGLIPGTGGSFEVGMDSRRLTTDNQFTTLDPQFPTSLSLSVNQPLWRDLKIDDNRLRIQVARKNIDLSDEQFREQIIDSVTQATRGYWDLVFAVRNFQVQIQALGLAVEQVQSNARLAEQGILAPIDVSEAQVQVSIFEQNVELARQTLTAAENGLKQLMLPDRSSRFWSQALDPTTPLDLVAPRSSLAESLQMALRNRPELTQLDTTSDINRLNESYFRSQTKPEIDLFATYQSGGLAGALLPAQPNPLTSGFSSLFERIDELSDSAGLPPLPTLDTGGGSGVPEFLLGGYGQSLSNLFSNRFPTAVVGVQISLPLRNRTAAANLGASLAEARRIENTRKQVEQLVESDVRNALQVLRSTELRLSSARQEVESARLQFESEQRRFGAGTTTVFLLLQRQTTLVNARSREARVGSELSKAIAEFLRSIGTTIEAHNIDITDL